MTATHLPLPSGLKTRPIGFWEDLPEVHAINVVDLLGVVVPGYWTMDFRARPDYTATRQLISDWCTSHGSHYYAADREHFSLETAASGARELGLGLVVVEDLS